MIQFPIRRWHRGCALMMLLLLLNACGYAGLNRPAPVRYGATNGAGTVIVQPGDALYKIAERHKVAMRDLIAVNRLKPPYNLYVGQSLKLPVPRAYRVQAGDTLYSISRAFGVDMTDLARQNNLKPPFAVRVGQNLALPGGAGSQKRTAIIADQRSLKTPPVPGRKPAPAYAGKQAVLAAVNTKNNPTAEKPMVDEPVTPAVLDPVQQVPEPVDTAIQGTKDAAPEIISVPEPPKPDFRAEISRTPPPSRSGRFIWPVTGRVISGYGPKEGGLHNDGINITAPGGASVRAAENGVVAYAGSELKGFGNLLLVKHSDGWMTAYAHLSNILVNRGQRVTQGQVIATVGKTGSVDTPQLHFEIRRGSQALDPKDYLDRGNVAGF